MNYRSYNIPRAHDEGFVNESQMGDYILTDFTFQGNDKWLLFAKSVEFIKDSEVTRKPPVIILHGGGPDHESLIPLAIQLANENTIILPDVRGYGRSVCTDSACHTWAQYSSDVVSLINMLSADSAIVGGAGLGATISLRAAVAHPNKIEGLILISVEDIENDKAKAAEIAFMEDFAKRVKELGLEKAWEPILKDLSPVIRAMVVDAIPRTNPESIAAAASIGYDRSFRNVKELSSIAVPTFIIPGMDWRHPEQLAKELSETISKSYFAPANLSAEIMTKEDFANAFAPIIRNFLNQISQ